MRRLTIDAEQAPDDVSEGECADDRGNREQHAASARSQHLLEIDPEAKSNHRRLQKDFCPLLVVSRIGMPERQAKSEAHCQCNRGRYPRRQARSDAEPEEYASYDRAIQRFVWNITRLLPPSAPNESNA